MHLPLSPTDWIAFCWFFVWWVGYVLFIEIHRRGRPSLVNELTRMREFWMRRAVARDVRIGDVNIIANLSNGSTFFASTTLLILGGLLAMLGTSDKLASIVLELPFTRRGPEELWDIKILLLTSIFVFAFFKFTWSLRLYHFCSVLVGAAPDPDSTADEHEQFVQRATQTSTLAAESFNHGLRTYYFALAALTWFLNPYAWMIATSWVVLILYRREFHSQALRVLAGLR